MPASASSRAKEESNSLQLDKLLPKKRESDFLSSPQESGQTEEQIREKLIAGMNGIKGVEAVIKVSLASSLARKLIRLGKGAKIEEKTNEILVALPQIAQAAGENADLAFIALSKDKIADYFTKNPQLLITHFESIVQATGENAGWAFYALSKDKTVNDFLSWCQGSMSRERFFISVFASDIAAIEIGRPLDYLHNEDLRNPQNLRTKYLNSLPSEKVLALLCSNPEYFYTSSNNLLFDRLASDIKNGKFGAQAKTLMDVIAEYRLENTELHRNLIFRAINYGRFYGGHAPVFDKDDAIKSMGTLLLPLKNMLGFDKTYFYLLANSLDGLSPGMKAAVQNELVKCKILAYSQSHLGLQGAKERYAASSFLLDYLKNPREKEVNFDPSKYRGKGGKLNIIQVFVAQDTGKDHYPMTQSWFAKYGQPKKGKSGELIYETKTARVILFMGEDEQANQNFVKQKLSENTNMLLTFRGHSYSLNDNMPLNIFGNCGCNILFIPGSCGSAGSTPEYLAQNPATDIDFVSNTSTGRGQVTNALLDIFISEDARIRAGGTPRTYKEILNDSANAKKIGQNGGDAATLKASSLGELLLEKVYRGG